MRLFVKHDNGTSQVYLDGVLEATSSETQNTPMDSLRIGINRRDELPWKGYIDEFKVYGRALNQDEVILNVSLITNAVVWEQLPWTTLLLVFNP